MIVYIATRAAHLINVQELRQLQNISKIILLNHQEHNYVNFGDETTFNFNVLVEVANEKNIEVDVINCWRKNELPMHDTADSKFNCIKNIIPWETSFFNMAFNHLHPTITDFSLDSATDIKHTFVSLNNKPHSFRCFMMDMFSKHGLIEDQAISWMMPTTTSGNNFHSNYEFTHWKEKKLKLSDNYDETGSSYMMMPTEYYSSFIQVVNGATMGPYFICEKITTPLLLKKPFVVFNKKNYNLWLTEFGFELYDEIFDYSFESIDDDRTRFEEGTKELVRINNMSREQQFSLYKKVIPKLEKNKNLAVKLAKEIPDILLPVTVNNQVDCNFRLI